MQAEEVGETAGCDAVPVCQDGAFEFLGSAGQLVHVVVVAQPCEDACRGAGEPLGWQPRMFQGLPGDFQQQSVLGVEYVGLASGDPEEVRVES